MSAADHVLNEVNRVVLGKEDAVKEVFMCLLAGGHVLLTDIPGTGKTTLALAFAKALNLSFRRVQFTPDVMPSDLTGFSVYMRSSESFQFQEGALFTNILLADELNRTSPKTQSALLEVMQENQVTAEGVTRPVPSPFFVIATENPYGSAGTQPIPHSQSDRFMIRLSLGYPDETSERTIALRENRDVLYSVTPQMGAEEVLELQRAVRDIFVKDTVADYCVALVRATREHPDLSAGASPRASISLMQMAKASALLHARTYVTADDVARQFPYVISHRLLPGASMRLEGRTMRDVIDTILTETKKPLPGDETP